MKNHSSIFLKLKRGVLLFVLIFIYQKNNAQVVGPGDWTSVRLYGHAYNTSGFTNAEYEWIANHNYLFTTEKRHANKVYGNPTSEFASNIAASQINNNNSYCKPLFYWNASVVYDNIYQTIQTAVSLNPSWVRSDGKWDYTSSQFRNWWVSNGIEQVTNTSHEGIFIDAVPNVAGIQGTTALGELENMMDQLSGLVIYNGFYTTKAGSMLAGIETLDHADGVFVETFMRANCNTPERGKQLLDTLLEVPANKYIIANYEPTTSWNSTDHKFGLACYLIVANNRSFFRFYNGLYNTDDLTYWHSDFGEYIGAPKGVAKVDGYIYTRSFDNAAVIVNLLTKTSSIVWEPTNSNEKLVHITKRNATGWALDGGNGGANGNNVYLWNANSSNQNQLWEEIDRGNGYYSYQKYGTNYSLDGKADGARNQSVHLWTTSATNQNQQWKKVAIGDGGYKLIKRNASGFALNGGSGGQANRQINLWDSSNSSQNLQWYITPVSSSLAVNYTSYIDDSIENVSVYPNPVKNTLIITFNDTYDDETTIILYTINGQKVMEAKPSNEVKLEISKLNAGIYILKIKTEQGTLVKKIIK